MLDGTPIEKVIPKPLRCECGHYPTITKLKDTHNARCKGCGVSYDFDATYSGAILQWNLKPNVPINPKNKVHFHPYIDIEITDELTVIKAATKAMNQKLFRQRNTKSKRERNLIHLMIDWNNVAYRMAKLFRKNPSKFNCNYK